MKRWPPCYAATPPLIITDHDGGDLLEPDDHFAAGGGDLVPYRGNGGDDGSSDGRCRRNVRGISAMAAGRASLDIGVGYLEDELDDDDDVGAPPTSSMNVTSRFDVDDVSSSTAAEPPCDPPSAAAAADDGAVVRGPDGPVVTDFATMTFPSNSDTLPAESDSVEPPSRPCVDGVAV